MIGGAERPGADDIGSADSEQFPAADTDAGWAEEALDEAEIETEGVVDKLGIADSNALGDGDAKDVLTVSSRCREPLQNTA